KQGMPHVKIENYTLAVTNKHPCTWNYLDQASKQSDPRAALIHSIEHYVSDVQGALQQAARLGLAWVAPYLCRTVDVFHTLGYRSERAARLDGMLSSALAPWEETVSVTLGIIITSDHAPDQLLRLTERLAAMYSDPPRTLLTFQSSSSPMPISRANSPCV